MKQLRSKNVVLGLTLVAASAFTTGCATSDGDAVCVDPKTETRVQDNKCDDDDEWDGHSSGFYWFYVPAGKTAPGIGKHYDSSKGYYKAPSGKSYNKGGVSKGGGKVSSGGFGSSGGKSSS